MSRIKLFLSILIALVLTGCATATPVQPTGSVPPAQEAYPPAIPTVVPQPATAYPPKVLVVTTTSVPATEARPPAAQAATQAALPNEAILILAPSSASKVNSPVGVSGISDPAFEQNLAVHVTGADNDPVGSGNATIKAEVGQRGNFYGKINFNVTAETPGRVSVINISPKDGGIVHLASVEVTLEPGNTMELNLPSQATGEEIVIFSPVPQAQISGGKAIINGYAQYVFESLLNVKICGEGSSGSPDPVCGTSDNVLGSGTLTLQAPDVGQPGPFQGEISYTTDKPVKGRVAVYSVSPRDGGILHLSSQMVTLAP